MFITRLHRVPTLRGRFDYLSSTHSPRSAGHRCLLQRFESALDVQKLGNRGKPVSRKETTLLSIREPYPRPLMAVSQRLYSCTGMSILTKTPSTYYTHVPVVIHPIIVTPNHSDLFIVTFIQSNIVTSLRANQ